MSVLYGSDDVLTAEASIRHCVNCATRGDACLQTRQEDFRQLAYLTILEETRTTIPHIQVKRVHHVHQIPGVYQTLVTTPAGAEISHVPTGRCVHVKHRCRNAPRL